jgi:hypothetical protein
MASIRGNALNLSVAQVLAADFVPSSVDRRGVCEKSGFVVHPDPRRPCGVKVFHRIAWSASTMDKTELLSWLEKYVQTLNNAGLDARLMLSEVPYLKVERK